MGGGRRGRRTEVVLLVTEVTDWICAGGGELSNDGVSLGTQRRNKETWQKERVCAAEAKSRKVR